MSLVMRFLLLWLDLVAFSSFSVAQDLSDAVPVNDCSEYNVVLNGARLDVYPGDGDYSDTDAINCALASAKKQQIKTVRLTKGRYEISANETGTTGVDITGYEGTLEGAGREKTILSIPGGDFDCATAKPRPIIFRGGNVTLRYMGMVSGDLCLDGSDTGAARQAMGASRPSRNISAPDAPRSHKTEAEDYLETYTLVSFSQIDCSKRTHFANVDRVDLENFASPEYYTTGVSFFGTVDGSCEEQGKGPLGTLKVNRSKVTGFGTGIYSSVWGGGQVDINYNTITSQAYGIYVENAGQVMTVRDNTIEVGSFEMPFRLNYPITWMVGIEIATWADWAPKKNSSSIESNEIKMGGLQPVGVDYVESYGVLVNVWNGQRPGHVVVIQRNVIEMTLPEVDAKVVGVSVQDTDGADIGNNYISGDGNHAIFLGAYASDKAVQAGRVGIQLPQSCGDAFGPIYDPYSACFGYYAAAPIGDPWRLIEKCDWIDGYFLPDNVENLRHPGFVRTVASAASGLRFTTETHGAWFANGSWEPLAFEGERQPAYPCAVYRRYGEVYPE